MTRKVIEHWLIWMAADVIYIWLYAERGLYLTSLLYVAFFAMCVVGWRDWMADTCRADRGGRMKRVVIIGAESTGKTTLATALAEHYQTAWVPEFGRLYTEARRYRGELWRSDEFTYIAIEQARMEDALAQNRQQGVDLRHRSVRHRDLARAVSGRAIRRCAGRCGGPQIRPLHGDGRGHAIRPRRYP